MHLSSHPQVFVNVFAFIKSNVFLFYDDNFFHKKVFLFRKRFICWSFCHINVLDHTRPDCTPSHPMMIYDDDYGDDDYGDDDYCDDDDDNGDDDGPL